MKKDVAWLLVATLILGTITASLTAYGAGSYFSKTLSSLIGDYGEYDVILQVREEMKDDAAKQIEKIIADTLPGAKLKEGPTLTGKTNFFVALPEAFQNKATYEDLNKIFSSIPGGASVGVMTEPRLTIRGVPSGAQNDLIREIETLPDVRFAFHDGASIAVLASGADKVQTVTDELNGLLKKYQVLEVSFPVGSEPANPIRTGDSLAQKLAAQTNLTVRNVSSDGKNDDMTHLVSTTLEMKRFLSAYATQAILTPQNGATLHRGDQITYTAPDSRTVIVSVTAMRSDGTGEGTIIQGDSSWLAQGAVSNNIQLTYRNPRRELSQALGQMSQFLSQVPSVTQNTKQISSIALQSLDQYENTLNQVSDSLNSVQQASQSLVQTASLLSSLDTGAIRLQLDASTQALNQLSATMQVVHLLQGSSSGSSLTNTVNNLTNLRSMLSGLDTIGEKSRQAQRLVNNTVAQSQNTLYQLRTFDVAGARSRLTTAQQQMDQLNQLNFSLMTAQMTGLAGALPQMTDEDIAKSISLMDKFAGGQVIPGARIQLLTLASVQTEALNSLTAAEVGHSNFSIYSTDLGVIEPNPRGQMLQMLLEIKALLAGIVSLVLTIAFLIMDHTVLMSLLKERQRRKGKGKFAFLFGLDRLYGFGIGALLLAALFFLSRATIPYLTWPFVLLLGGSLGYLVAVFAEKINPLHKEEIAAGEALGLSFDQIAREIVIPAARPGLLQKMNRRHLKFRG